jgi:outer membrane immunogenic protein
MIVKRRLLRGAALPALLASPAIAADMPVKAPPPPPPAVFSWTGFYVGLNAGGTWARSNADTSVNCNVPFVGPPFPYICDSTFAPNAAAVSAAGSGTINASGFTGGVQVGYNWQGPNLIYGLETDFSAFHLRGSRQGTGTYPANFALGIAGSPFAINSSFNTDWLYTLRGRIGVPVSSNLMAYATGGLALTRLGVSNSFSDNVVPTGLAFNAAGSANANATKAGWVVGGGLEYALVKNWSVKAEYLFMDFGKVTATGTIINPSIAGYAQGISTSSDLTAQVARAGVNYKF